MTFDSLRGWWRRLIYRDGVSPDAGRLDAEKAQVERDQQELTAQLARLRQLRAERDLYQRRLSGGGGGGGGSGGGG